MRYATELEVRRIEDPLAHIAESYAEGAFDLRELERRIENHLRGVAERFPLPPAPDIERRS